MKDAIIRLLRRSKWGSILLYAVLNRYARHTAKRNAELPVHAQSKDVSVPDSVTYVETAFEAILGHGGLTQADFEGSRVLELGPGDNLGLALRFVAAGAEQVVTLDRFEILRDPGVEREIYRGVLAGLAPEERARAETTVRFGERTTFDQARLRTIYGIGVEDAAGTLEPESFDFILSVAVLEHIYDPDASLAAMDRLLKPGGVLLHQLDFRDHTMFTGGGHHPLTHLTIGPRLWRAITYDWGGPNRRLIDYWRDRLGRLGYDSRLLVNRVLGVGADVDAHDALTAGVEVSDKQRRLIAEVRPKLQPQFRDLPDEDLVPACVFIVARKPSGTRTDYSPSRPRSSVAR